jgi:CRISPR/Cas system endoribonuclease Cas6 (RAMP superfamily)
MRLLDMANYLGVGRSTSIGLGAVKVTPIRLGNA